MQFFVVKPNQLGKERPYIANNIAATRAAYGLDDIGRFKQLPTRTELSSSQTQGQRRDHPQHSSLGSRARWSRVIASCRSCARTIRSSTADVDRSYVIGGAYRETMLSPRELNIDGLPSNARTWVNEHITYTHGFGVALSAVNQVKADGSPDFLVQDVPPVSNSPGPEDHSAAHLLRREGHQLYASQDKRPGVRLSFGSGGGDVYKDYTGGGGIQIGSFFNRLAFSLRFGTISFFTSNGDRRAGSRVIMRNNIDDRLQTAAPFLSFDPTPTWSSPAAVSSGSSTATRRPTPTRTRQPAGQPQLHAQLGEGGHRRL